MPSHIAGVVGSRRLAFELRDIDPDVVPLNFLIPMDGTPLENTVPLEPMECLRIIALYRFIPPHQEIKIAGNPVKTTIPGRKQVWRALDRSGRMLGDVLHLQEHPPQG